MKSFTVLQAHPAMQCSVEQSMSTVKSLNQSTIANGLQLTKANAIIHRVYLAMNTITQNRAIIYFTPHNGTS